MDNAHQRVDVLNSLLRDLANLSQKRIDFIRQKTTDDDDPFADVNEEDALTQEICQKISQADKHVAALKEAFGNLADEHQTLRGLVTTLEGNLASIHTMYRNAMQAQTQNASQQWDDLRAKLFRSRLDLSESRTKLIQLEEELRQSRQDLDQQQRTVEQQLAMQAMANSISLGKTQHITAAVKEQLSLEELRDIMKAAYRADLRKICEFVGDLPRIDQRIVCCVTLYDEMERREDLSDNGTMVLVYRIKETMDLKNFRNASREADLRAVKARIPPSLVALFWHTFQIKTGDYYIENFPFGSTQNESQAELFEMVARKNGEEFEIHKKFGGSYSYGTLSNIFSILTLGMSMGSPGWHKTNPFHIEPKIFQGKLVCHLTNKCFPYRPIPNAEFVAK